MSYACDPWAPERPDSHLCGGSFDLEVTAQRSGVYTHVAAHPGGEAPLTARQTSRDTKDLVQNTGICWGLMCGGSIGRKTDQLGTCSQGRSGRIAPDTQPLTRSVTRARIRAVIDRDRDLLQARPWTCLTCTSWCDACSSCVRRTGLSHSIYEEELGPREPGDVTQTSRFGLPHPFTL